MFEKNLSSSASEREHLIQAANGKIGYESQTGRDADGCHINILMHFSYELWAIWIIQIFLNFVPSHKDKPNAPWHDHIIKSHSCFS